MVCANIREQLHHWFDESASGAMPTAAAEHVRDCHDCRNFIRQWNAIELRLQSVRSEPVTLSPDFTRTLNTRLQEERTRSRRFWLSRDVLFLGSPFQRMMVSATAYLLLILLAFQVVRLSRTYYERTRTNEPMTAQGERSAPTPAGTPAAFPPALPLANTTR
jgi:predicted anti-sigma-YlaC factor YlaD